MSNQADLLDRLGATALECRALLREMHEAEKDFRQAMSEIRQLTASLRQSVEDRSIVGPVVESWNKQLVQYQKEVTDRLDRWMQSVTTVVVDQFHEALSPFLSHAELLKLSAVARMPREFPV